MGTTCPKSILLCNQKTIFLRETFLRSILTVDLLKVAPVSRDMNKLMMDKWIKYNCFQVEEPFSEIRRPLPGALFCKRCSSCKRPCMHRCKSLSEFN